jgi:hypothetical protein
MHDHVNRPAPRNVTDALDASVATSHPGLSATQDRCRPRRGAYSRTMTTPIMACAAERNRKDGRN